MIERQIFPKSFSAPLEVSDFWVIKLAKTKTGQLIKFLNRIENREEAIDLTIE